MKGFNVLNWTRRTMWRTVLALCTRFWLGAFGLVLIAFAEWRI